VIVSEAFLEFSFAAERAPLLLVLRTTSFANINFIKIIFQDQLTQLAINTVILGFFTKFAAFLTFTLGSSFLLLRAFAQTFFQLFCFAFRTFLLASSDFFTTLSGFAFLDGFRLFAFVQMTAV